MAPCFSLLPGEKVLRLAGAPDRALETLTRFLDEAVPAEMLEITKGDESAFSWSFKAVVFVDYVPVHVQARAWLEDSRIAGLGLRTTSSHDIVKFHEFVALAEAFLLSQGVEVLGQGGSSVQRARGSTELIEEFEDFEEDDIEDEQVWTERVRPLLDDILGEPKAQFTALREEAAQGIARIGESGTPACHVALARELLKREDQMLQVFENASLAEAYPLAVTLKFAALSMEAAETLASAGLCARLEKLIATRSGLVAREISNSVQAIAEAATITSSALAFGKLEWEPAKDTFKHDASKYDSSISNLSTACTNYDGMGTWQSEGASTIECMSGRVSYADDF